MKLNDSIDHGFSTFKLDEIREQFIKSERNHLSLETEDDFIAYIQLLCEPLYENLQILAWSMENIPYKALIMTKGEIYEHFSITPSVVERLWRNRAINPVRISGNRQYFDVRDVFEKTVVEGKYIYGRIRKKGTYSKQAIAL